MEVTVDNDVVLSEAWSRVRDAELPDHTIRYGITSLRKLVLLCQELQKVYGEEPFPLSHRRVAEHMRLVAYKPDAQGFRWDYPLIVRWVRKRLNNRTLKIEEERKWVGNTYRYVAED